MPVKKPGGTDYRPVQDLREVTKWVSDIYPTVPNPYTLLSSLLPEYTWYTVLDLKMLFSAYPWRPRARRYLPLNGLRGKVNR